MKKHLNLLLDMLELSILSSIQSKKKFFLEVFLILMNNLFFVALWGIFFNRFDAIAGWTFSDVMAVIAIASGAFGLKEIAFGGVQKISPLILNGEIDSYLVKPKHTLLLIAASKSFPKGWGHLATGLLLTAFGGFATLLSVPFILASMILGCLTFTSAAIIIYSLPFWLGPVQNGTKRYYETLLLFSLYPAHTYTGLFKVALFSILPAGLIGTLPVEILQHFSLAKLLYLLGGTATFCVLALFTFNKGLQNYESGNKFIIQR
jgi:ABC-2 type transport system permease protein